MCATTALERAVAHRSGGKGSTMLLRGTATAAVLTGFNIPVQPGHQEADVAENGGASSS
jgi:hypothetical protein